MLKKTVRDGDPKKTDQQEHARSDRLKEDKFKPAPTAGARIVAAELLDEFLRAADNAVTALDSRLRREALAPFARDFESTRRLRRSVSWHTSLIVNGLAAVDVVGSPGWARSTGRRLMRALLCR